MTAQAMNSKGEPTAGIPLNGHIIEPTPNYLSLYLQNNASLSHHQVSFFLQ